MILCNLKKHYQLQVTPHTHFKVAQDKIYTKPGISKNVTTINQHGNPPKMGLKRREPIVDNDFNIGPVDREAAKFLVQSYEDVVVVDIDDHSLKAGKLVRNVSEQFIFGEVIFFHIHVVSKHMRT
jgi:hypothetical protein